MEENKTTEQPIEEVKEAEAKETKKDKKLDKKELTAKIEELEALIKDKDIGVL